MRSPHTAIPVTITLLFFFHPRQCESFSVQPPRLSIAPSKTSSTVLFLGDFFKFGKKDDPPPEPEAAPYEDAAYDSDDPVEKMFSFFFGKREEAPMGMPRFGAEKFPELYPATKTEWAAILPEDTKDTTPLRPYLKNTNLEFRPLKLAYDANRDGWDAFKFHALVDRNGPSVVSCVVNDGTRCGGYNPKGWVGIGEARGSIAAFLFTMNGGGSRDTDAPPGVKLRKVGGPGMAQMDYPEQGVSFGADSLVIPLGRNNPKMARSKLGSYYERFEDGGNSLFGTKGQVILKDLKVYQGVYEEGEFIPFTDAEPFALY